MSNSKIEQPGAKQAGTAMIWKALQLGGTKVIFMLRLLILAWLLSPDDFGLLAIATTAIGFLMKVTDIGMIPALVQGEDIDDSHYDVAWTVGITRTLGVTLVVILAAPLIAQIFDEPRATPIIQVLAFRPFVEAIASIKVASLTRDLQFRPLTILKLAEAVVNFVFSVALASWLGVWALVIGTLAGAVTYLVLSYILAPHRPRFSIKWSTIRPLIRFGRWIFVTGLVVMIGNYVLRVVISRQLGTAELGLYFLAAQLAFLPAEAASEIVGTVAFPLFARLQLDRQRAAQTFRTVFIGLSVILFPVCSLLIALAPALEQNVLGTQWEGTAPVIRVLALVSMIGILGEITVPIFNGFGHPSKVTLIEVIQSTSIILLVWGLTTRFGLVGAALAWLPTAIISQFVSIFLIRRLLPRPFAKLGRPLLAITAVTLTSSLLAFAINSMVPTLVGLILAVILSVVTFGSLLWLANRRFSLGFVTELNQMFPQFSSLLNYSQRIASRI